MYFEIPRGLLLLRESDFGTTLDQLMFLFPDDYLKEIGNERTRWKVEPGASGIGRVAYAVLSLNKETGEILVFGAIENGRASEHLHVDGETIYTLAGVGFDFTDEGKSVSLEAGSIIVHRKDSIHSPGTPNFWVFIYYQPAGMRTTGN